MSTSLSPHPGLPFVDAATLRRVLEPRALVARLRQAFRDGATVPLRHSHVVDASEGARLLLMPAWRARACLGVKLVTVYPGNAARGAATVGALYVLMDGATGHPRALLDGEALTLARTAAASALASGYLSRPDARTLLVVGTGQLAPWLARAHCAVRRIHDVLVWGRDPARAEATAASLRADGLPATAAADLGGALASADIVSCATTATTPVLPGSAVATGTHVDLVGGFTPQMREADDALVQRASLFVDTREAALAEAGDLVQPMMRGLIRPEQVRAELADLCGDRHEGRSGPSEITLFKSVGTALEDLAAAEFALERLAAGA